MSLPTGARRNHAAGFVLLACAVPLLWFSSPAHALAPAAWLAPVLIVRFLRDRRPLRGLLAVWLVASCVAVVAGYGFNPLPLPVHLVFAPLATLAGLAPYLLDRVVAPRLRGFAGTLVLPLAVTVWDYAQTFFYDATIASPAYTQAGVLPLIQLASLTGIWGITFVVYWFAGVANWVWEAQHSATRRSALRPGLAIYAAVMLAVAGWGVARLALAPRASRTVAVAGVSVDYLPVAAAAYRAVHGQTLQIPADVAAGDPDTTRAMLALEEWVKRPGDPRFAPVRAELDVVYNKLFAATREAARGGARIVAWSEANAQVLATDEPALVARASRLAREEGIVLYMPLAVFTPGRAPFTGGQGAMENKVLAIGPDGSVLSSYRKTKLVVGETSLRGDGVIPVQRTAWGTLAATICYDLDTPAYARQAGVSGVDLMVTPSGDWRAIADWHADIARLRAVENGYSVLRPVSRGRMLAADQYGRTAASADWWSMQQPAIAAELPVERVATVYTRIGDSFAWLCIAVLAIISLTQRRKGAKVAQRDSLVSILKPGTEQRWSVH